MSGINQTPIDLYRVIKARNLCSNFNFNHTIVDVRLNDFLSDDQVTTPSFLGSFEIVDTSGEVYDVDKAFYHDINRNQFCTVQRIDGKGIVLTDRETHTNKIGTMMPLPIISDVSTSKQTDIDVNHCHTWYYVNAKEIRNHKTVYNYLQNKPDSCNIKLGNQRVCVFLCFKLAAGTVLPDGYELVEDKTHDGQWLLQRSDTNPFVAYATTSNDLDYAMVPELVSLSWIFDGIQLIGTSTISIGSNQGENSKTLWHLASIIGGYFTNLSTKALAADAYDVLTHLQDTQFAAKDTLKDSPMGKKLLRVLDDLFSSCSYLDFIYIDQFKR